MTNNEAQEYDAFEGHAAEDHAHKDDPKEGGLGEEDRSEPEQDTHHDPAASDRRMLKVHLLHLPFSLNRVCLITGEFLILLLTSLMVIPALGFFVGLAINPFTFLFGLIVTIALCVLLNKRSLLEVGIASILGIAITITACILWAQVYDLSVDANMYHRLIIHALGNGWIPNLGSVEPWQYQFEPFDPASAVWNDNINSNSTDGARFTEVISATWIDHYPKGVYCIGAAFYSAFGNLEAGKAYNVIIMIGCALILAPSLNKNLLSAPQSTIIAVLAVLNPITLVQLMTAYNDGFLMMSILVLLVGIIIYLIQRSKEDRILALVLISCGFTLCAQTKFTGFVYAGVFSFCFYVFFIAIMLLKHEKHRLRSVLCISGFFAAVILVNFAVVGYSTYIMNLLEHGNPFYPLFGMGAVDIMSINEPPGFSRMSNIEKLFIATFGELSNPHMNQSFFEGAQLKIPFTISGDEIKKLGFTDLRISGFGVLYSGILILQLVVIGATIKFIFEKHRKLFWAFICFAIPALLLLVGLSESWWARYSSYQYFFNIFALVFLFAYFRDHSERPRLFSGIAAIVFSTLLFVNTVIFFPSAIVSKISNSEMIDIHLDYMEEMTDEGHRILLDYNRELPGILYLLSENDIDFVLVDPDEEDTSIDYDWSIGYLEYKVIDR